MNFKCYERDEWAAYASLAEAIAAILTAAIGARAKQPASLRKKLELRGIHASTAIEREIKDLAGCRVIFYTNGDVTRFTNSGVIDQNFEIIEAKIHYPGRAIADAAELYISNHYIVQLRPERVALPEYARFGGMRCEIQIQTILNHAWAEMAHDTIYKAPALGAFGGREFDGIKSRMQKVAHKYLLPAGYEFQKITHDFQRLIEGKALFDGDALEAIVDAPDNNVRAAALETFAENVLPLYDDLQILYPEIITRLVTAADRARVTPPAVIETPYGGLQAKTYSDIVMAIADIFTRYRYLDIQATFEALLKLYDVAGSYDEHKPLMKLGRALAKHQMQVWQLHGPIAQVILIGRIEMLNDDERRVLSPLLNTMLSEMLGTEVSGTTNSSSAVTFHRGAVVASDALRDVRTKAIDLLTHQFALAESDKERRAVLLTLQGGTRPPIGAAYDNALARLVMDDTCTIIAFQTEVVSTLSLDLRQSTEERVHRSYWMYAELSKTMRDDPHLVAARARVEVAALAFRAVVNADPDFVIYKTLVGFNSVFPPAWKDKEFRHEQAKAYRAEQVNVLLASVDVTNADAWFNRISRYARTESNDAATFPVFGNFLERLAEAQPTIVFSYLDRLEGPLLNFVPGMLAGLTRSAERAQALVRINGWLAVGKHIEQIAWYLRFADPFDEALLCRALDSAIRHDDLDAVRNVLVASVSQFAAHPGTLVEEAFLPALRSLKAAGNLSWVQMTWFSWLGSPIIRALDEDQANVVLDALVSYPDLEYDAEYIAAAIAEQWPARVVAFIGDRQAFARTDAAPPRYDAVAFEVHQLQLPLAAAPDIMLDGARQWFDANPLHFTYQGARLLASVFPNLSNGLETRLNALIAGGNEQDLAFVLGVLSAFEGKACIYALVRLIISRLDLGNDLLHEARSVLDQSGVVHGEFGFAELHGNRKKLLRPWLADPSENVRMFATEQIHTLDLRIAAETRSAEASIAMRKLNHGEELDGSAVHAA
jgi:ppGpp synthetase/RelA/SpoT-type nucleotidyltranferase